MPRMRKIFNTLIASLNELVSVVIFILYIFILLGLLGVQLFQGSTHNKCHLTEAPINSTFWPEVQEQRLCDLYDVGGRQCPKDTYCGNRMLAGVEQNNSSIKYNSNLEYGMGTFDNFFQSLLAIFQIISQDNVGLKLINVSLFTL